MKPTLLLATLTLAAVTSLSFASTELEMLRAQRAEIDRQIQVLEKQKLAEEKPVAAAPPETDYIVKKGDSMERVARRNGIAASALASANGMKEGSIIHPGQRLKLPAGAKIAAAPALAPVPAPVEQRYTVRQGETFYSISKKHGVSVKSLMSANPKVKANALRPGLVITIKKAPAAGTTTVMAAKTPSTGDKAPAAATDATTASKAPASTPGTAETGDAASSPAKKAVVRPVTIDGEMTYGQFAEKHGTSPARLNELNGLDLTDATLLAKGSELYIPAQP